MMLLHRNVLEKVKVEEEEKLEKDALADLEDASSHQHSGTPVGSDTPSKAKGKASPKLVNFEHTILISMLPPCFD